LVGATLALATLHAPVRGAAAPAPAGDEVAASIVPAYAAADLPAAPAAPARGPEPAAEEAPAPPPPAPQPPAQAEARPAGQTYGTRVSFLASPEEAMRVAQRERKLVFVLHISGNFEESCFT
jgi:hypothetical protein